MDDFDVHILIVVPIYLDNKVDIMQFTLIPKFTQDELVTVLHEETQLLVLNEELYELNRQCILINKIHYCNSLGHKVRENTCLFNIISNQENSQCTFINIDSFQETVLEISNTNFVVILNKDKNKVNINCNSEYEEYLRNKGIYLLENKNCKINKKSIISKISTGKPIIINNYKFNFTSKNKLNFTINLEHVKEMSILKERPQEIQDIDMKHITIHGIIKYCLITIIIIIIIIMVCKFKTKIVHEITKKSDFPVTFESRGGGVI